MTVWAALLVIDDGACCTTAEAWEMVAVQMSDDDGCTLSMKTADDERQSGRWRAHMVTIWRNWSMTGTDAQWRTMMCTTDHTFERPRDCLGHLMSASVTAPPNFLRGGVSFFFYTLIHHAT